MRDEGVLGAGKVSDGIVLGRGGGQSVIPLANPFHLLVNLAGSLLFLTHLLELLLFNSSLKHRAYPWRDRLQILLVGMFHVRGLSAPAAIDETNKEANHA